MTKSIIYCDCCGKEVNARGWEETPYPFQIIVTTDCQNPLGYLKERPGFQGVNLYFEHICLTCAKGLAKINADFIMNKRSKIDTKRYESYKKIYTKK